MTYYANCCNQQPPSYSGVTINITNPALNMPGTACVTAVPNVVSENRSSRTSSSVYNEWLPQAYPQQYYINGFDSHNGLIGKNPAEAGMQNLSGKNSEQNSGSDLQYAATENLPQDYFTEADTTTSKAIINDLDTLRAEEIETEKNGKKSKVVALTNEYIMSLENYLNNPNTDIRLMASKEILTRFDEDRNRYDDAALNALLNKMLQDPNKLVRIAALSALSSELASGNDYTMELLNKIQQNPNADPQDVLEASQILLKRASETEVVYTPAY